MMKFFRKYFLNLKNLFFYFLIVLMFMFPIIIIKNSTYQSYDYISEQVEKSSFKKKTKKEISQNSEIITINSNEIVIFDNETNDWFYLNFNKDFYSELYDLEHENLVYENYITTTLDPKTGDMLLQFSKDQIDFNKGFGEYIYFDLETFEFISYLSPDGGSYITTQNNLNPYTRYEIVRAFDADGWSSDKYSTSIGIYTEQSFDSKYIQTNEITNFDDSSYSDFWAENNTVLGLYVATSEPVQHGSEDTPQLEVKYYNQDYMLLKYKTNPNGENIDNEDFTDKYNNNYFVIDLNKTLKEDSHINNIETYDKDYKVFQDVSVSQMSFVDDNKNKFDSAIDNYTNIIIIDKSNFIIETSSNSYLFVLNKENQFNLYETINGDDFAILDNQYLFFNSENLLQIIELNEYNILFEYESSNLGSLKLSTIRNDFLVSSSEKGIFTIDNNFGINQITYISNYQVFFSSTNYSMVYDLDTNRYSLIVNLLFSIDITYGTDNLVLYYKDDDQYIFNSSKADKTGQILTKDSVITIYNNPNSYTRSFVWSYEVEDLTINGEVIPKSINKKWVINVSDYIDLTKSINELNLVFHVSNYDGKQFEIEINYLVLENFEPKIEVSNSSGNQQNSFLYYSSLEEGIISGYNISSNTQIEIIDRQLIENVYVKTYSKDGSQMDSYLITDLFSNHFISLDQKYDYLINVTDIFGNEWYYWFSSNINDSEDIYWNSTEGTNIKKQLIDSGYSSNQIENANQLQITFMINSLYNQISLNKFEINQKDWVDDVTHWNNHFLILNNKVDPSTHSISANLSSFDYFVNQRIKIDLQNYYFEETNTSYYEGNFSSNYYISFPDLTSNSKAFKYDKGINILISPKPYSVFKDSKLINIYPGWMFSYIDLNQVNNNKITSHDQKIKIDNSLNKTLKKDFKKHLDSTKDIDNLKSIFWTDFNTWSLNYYNWEVELQNQIEVPFETYSLDVPIETFINWFDVTYSIKTRAFSDKIRKIEIKIYPIISTPEASLFVNSTKIQINYNLWILWLILTVIFLLLILLGLFVLFVYIKARIDNKNNLDTDEKSNESNQEYINEDFINQDTSHDYQDYEYLN